MTLAAPVDSNKVDIKAIYQDLRKSVSPKYRALLDVDSIQTWLDALIWRNRGLSASTGRKNLQVIYEFSQFVKKDPNELVEDARRSLKDRETEYKYVKKLNEWSKELNSQNISWNVMIKKLDTVKSFFRQNHVRLDYKAPTREKTPYPFVPPKELLQYAFLNCVPRSQQRRWLLTQSQCGLSELDLLTLDIDAQNDDETKRDYDGLIFESVRKQYSKGACPIVIVLPRRKTGMVTITFLGEEPVSMMEFYGSRLFPWKIGSDPGRTIRYHFERLQEKLGQSKFQAHTMRKYFQTTLENADFHPNTIKRMMGHSPGDTEGAYSGPPIPMLRAKYEDAYSRLRLFEPKWKDQLATISKPDLGMQ